MYTKLFFFLISFNFFPSLIQPKVSNCRNKFDSSDWIYCTKFGTANAKNLEIEVKAKHTSIFKNAEGLNYIELGIYKDYNWEEVMNDK